MTRYTVPVIVAGLRRRLSVGRARVRDARRALQGPPPPQSAPFPAHFDSWISRRQGRSGASFPDIWRKQQLEVADPARVAVVIHVFYPDLVAELLAHLAHVPVPCDLVVTNSSGEDVAIDLAGLPHVRLVGVFDTANHGRDILPLVHVVNAGLLDPYDLVLKVHTKRSTWRAGHATLAGDGDGWRAELLDGLLGSRDNVAEIIGAFAENPDLGMVTADGSLLGPEYWGGDEEITRHVLRRLELPLHAHRLRFASGSFYWARGFVLQGLRALALGTEDFEEEAGQVDGTTAHAVERAIGILAEEAGYRLAERAGVVARPDSYERYGTAARTRRVRVLPFYLPQFHPVPENDAWWGRGFTEWTNVTAARATFRGHMQPLLPSELGYYDLRLPQVREHQMTLASEHGVEGFMYYYYWFAGKRLLSLPIDALLASDLQKPFCIMWANENWTRRWDGRSTDVLIGQDYDSVPAETFIDDVMPFLRDRRYIRVDGRPLLAVYRISQIPGHREVLAHWRRRCADEGVGDPLLIGVDVAKEFDGVLGDAASAGLDGLLGFPPHNMRWEWLPHHGLDVDPRFQGNILSYEVLVTDAEKRLRSLAEDAFPGVMTGFDNTARRQWRPDLWYGANPYTFRRWLASAAAAVADREPERRVVFVNAWNEWAEGAVLEPSQRFGRSFLLAVRDVVNG